MQIFYICSRKKVYTIFDCKFMSIITRTDEHPTITEVSQQSIVAGELYIFSRCYPVRQDEKTLWGVVDCLCHSNIRLESCSTDLREFRFWIPLPDEYRFCRRATPAEAMEYGWECSYYESHHHIKQ